MIIGEDSVFRKIPSVLDRRQALFMEAIRYSVEMAALAYHRLQKTLPLMTKKMEDVDKDTPSSVSVMLDAWSIVDSLHRLRGLAEKMPGVKGKYKNPKFRLFMGSTENITTLRHTVQHLDTEIGGVVDDKDWAVLGSLSWCLVNPERNEITACTFMPGIPMGSRPLINPAGRRIWHLPVDFITIERSGVSVCLSDAMRRMEALVASMEKGFSDACAEQIPEEHKGKTYGADLLLCVVMSVAAQQIVPEDTPDPEPELPPVEGGEEDDE
ncbi:MAG: hypothetical protein ABSD56_03885 [Bryobacteraceae bacterium]